MDTETDFMLADAQLRTQFAAEIPQLVHATGPVSYDYHFPKRALFDRVVELSWHKDDSLFAGATTHVAVQNGHLLGIEIGFTGTQWNPRKAALGPIWAQMLADGDGELEEHAPADRRGCVARGDGR